MNESRGVLTDRGDQIDSKFSASFTKGMRTCYIVKAELRLKGRHVSIYAH